MVVLDILEPFLSFSMRVRNETNFWVIWVSCWSCSKMLFLRCLSLWQSVDERDKDEEEQPHLFLSLWAALNSCGSRDNRLEGRPVRTGRISREEIQVSTCHPVSEISEGRIFMEVYFYSVRGNLRQKIPLLNLILTGEVTYSEQVINVWRISLRHGLLFRPELRSLLPREACTNRSAQVGSEALKMGYVCCLTHWWSLMMIMAVWEIQDEAFLRFWAKVSKVGDYFWIASGLGREYRSRDARLHINPLVTVPSDTS